MDNRFSIYHDDFWGEDPNHNGMLTSAREVLSKIFTTYKITPSKILDVGCGKGAWLRAAKELGSKYSCGIDGPWLRKEDIPIENKVDEYYSVDLEIEFPTISNFDAVICVEVVEHISNSRSSVLVDFLCKSSNFIIFSSAPKGQGGEYHINEQPDSFWNDMFFKNEFSIDNSIKDHLKQLKKTNRWYKNNIRIFKK